MFFHGKQHLIIIGILILLVISIEDAFCETGFLDVVSNPEGVDIYVDGKYVGKTPLTGLEITSGKRHIQARKKGFGTASKEVVIKTDDVVSIKIPLKKQSGSKKNEITMQQDMGSLLVINRLGPVPVYIDGSEKGKGSMTIEKISTGIHELKVNEFSNNITIYKDYKLKVTVSNAGIIILNDLEKIKKEKAKIIEDRRKAEERERQRRLKQEMAESKAAEREREERLKAEKERKIMERKRNHEADKEFLRGSWVLEWCASGGCFKRRIGLISYDNEAISFKIVQGGKEYKYSGTYYNGSFKAYLKLKRSTTSAIGNRSGNTIQGELGDVQSTQKAKFWMTKY